MSESVLIQGTGSWYEEMINNRNKSVVKGMAWNSDGQKICIVYEDGAVIVGSVDGNRIWGKELKGSALTGVQWSPDGKLLLFSLRDGEVHVYDNQGNFVMKLAILCLPAGGQVVWVKSVQVVGLAWYDGRNGYVDVDCPCLVVCYQSGHIQIMRDENDDSPVVLDTGISAVCCCWNHNGSVLAVTGSTLLSGDTKSCNVIQFFTPFGEHLRTMKIPGREVSCCVWEGSSLRVALAVDSFIYFANIRPSYKWGYFSHTVVYSYNRQDRPGTNVIFWNTNNNECYSKKVRGLLGVAACKDHCVLAVRAEDATGQFGLILCNAIATPVDSKYMDMEPLFVAINSSHVFAASRDNFLLWHYITPKTHSTLGNAGSRHRKERLYHIDDTPSGVAEVIQDLDHTFQPTISTQVSVDPICCMAVSEKVLLIGRQSGTIQRYSLPQVALVQRYSQSCRPHSIAINCNSTMASVIDVTGVLTLLELEGASGGSNLERKDVWAMVWATDNPQLLAIMEKTRMYVLRGEDPEEPIPSVGYICSFQDLEIRAVLLDELMHSEPTKEQHLLDMEVKSLRDTRQLLDKVGITEASAFIEENPHPRLWRLLAEAAVKKLDLVTAEAAFVRCSDYAGVQLVKRIANVTSDHLKRAQVAAYLHEFDEAEQLYLDADRRDLAIALRERLGDWFRVVELLKASSTAGSTAQCEAAWDNIGEYFAERSQWESAREYFEKAGNTERLIQCYQQLEDYEALGSTAANLPEKHPLLPRIAEIFVTMGMCPEAVSTYVKSGSVQLAVEASVTLNQWDQAVALAEQHNSLADIGRLLDKYASTLLAQGTSLEVVQLYRKAGRYLDAAKLMYQMAEEEAQKRSKPLRLKKLYVLAALLVEEYNTHRQITHSSVGNKSTAVLFADPADTHVRMLDSAWRGAEAYHFLMLAHRQLYQGNADAAMTTALYLKHYEDILHPEDIYCLLALASSACKTFSVCSRAFMKLESLDSVSESKRGEYSELALNIFTKHMGRETHHSRQQQCTSCSVTIPLWSGTCPSCGVRYPACTATGQPISSLSEAWSCPWCHHSALYPEMDRREVCPLCHSDSSTHL
ncbi:WD repeat-containing protein 35-like [Homalodisca vitripennis]|uniref:WD repeat-containing protein 35-like n=1 Tax=Homalodisca vitripennis TaxID=197043 RepID=UPI001EEC8738|nr:WD repeat-containing protein 35-like [Homalodisca vitripennis]